MKWPFTKQKAVDPDHQRWEEEQIAFEARLQIGEFLSWIYDSPYAHERVEILRKEWENTRLINPSDLQPEFNVGGLYWRPCRGEVIEVEILKEAKS